MSKKSILQKPILGVLFDFDGTLTKPGTVDYRKVRHELNCPVDKPIVEYLSTLPEPDQSEALQRLDQLEYAGAECSESNLGAETVIQFLNHRRIPFSVLSRNSRRSVHRALENISFLGESDFQLMITRDDPYPLKPDPSAVLLVAENMGISVDQLLTVGDYIYDIEAGNRAGSPTVHLTNHRKDLICPASIVIDELIELIPIFDSLTV